MPTRRLAFLAILSLAIFALLACAHFVEALIVVTGVDGTHPAQVCVRSTSTAIVLGRCGFISSRMCGLMNPGWTPPPRRRTRFKFGVPPDMRRLNLTQFDVGMDLNHHWGVQARCFIPLWCPMLPCTIFPLLWLRGRRARGRGFRVEGVTAGEAAGGG